MNEQGLKRSLQERHIRLMALGSTIGVGLFLGSATAIDLAGPAILISTSSVARRYSSSCARWAKWLYINRSPVYSVDTPIII
jgi:hypothetical protein